MHLLLMDDVPERLERLQSSFDDLQPTWRVTGVADAQDALTILSALPCHAVVASSSRSRREVLDILGSARELRPTALRIAVAGSDDDVAPFIRTEIAHRVAVSPISADRLAASLNSMRTLESMLGSKQLLERISKVERLPPSPDVALALIRENAGGTSDMSGVARRVHGDAGLAAKVLQLSNSAYYSRGKPILEIERALTRLGMDTVINLVLAVQSFINPDVQNRAVLASQMAGRVLRDLKKDSLSPIAATASTLAYIGKLLNLRSEDFVTANNDDDADDIAERLPTESVAGAYLLSRWGLPWPIVEAVAYHKHPMMASEENFGVTTAVHTACALANGEALDEEWLEGLDAMEFVPSWEASAKECGAPPRPH